MKHELKEIPFNNGNLLGVKTEDGQVWLGVKKACLDIGLTEGQAQRQLTNLQNDLVFKDAVKNLNCKFATQVRNIICIKEDFVTLWLAKISLTPAMQKKNPEAVQKLLRYQLKAQKVLHNAFIGTEEQKQQFYDELGLKGQILEMKEIQRIQTVQINNMEATLEKQSELLTSVMDNMTLSTRQQEKILETARIRINYLLGGAHSSLYKQNARKYMINLWNNIKEVFHCGSSYKDLNPNSYNDAIDYINNWRYTGN